MSDIINDKQIIELLKGKTMKVYALLLTRDSMRMRDIQHALDFSSPSLVLHHLTKLMNAELVKKDEYGDYSIKKDVRVGSLTLFVQLGRHFLPRFVFLASLLVCILVPYVILFMAIPPDGKDILFLSVVLSTIILLLYESYRIWFMNPL